MAVSGLTGTQRWFFNFQISISAAIRRDFARWVWPKTGSQPALAAAIFSHAPSIPATALGGMQHMSTLGPSVLNILQSLKATDDQTALITAKAFAKILKEAPHLVAYTQKFHGGGYVGQYTYRTTGFD